QKVEKPADGPRMETRSQTAKRLSDAGIPTPPFKQKRKLYSEGRRNRKKIPIGERYQIQHIHELRKKPDTIPFDEDFKSGELMWLPGALPEDKVKKYIEFCKSLGPKNHCKIDVALNVLHQFEYNVNAAKEFVTEYVE